MRLAREYGEGKYAITAYGQGGVRVNETVHRQSLVVMPDQLLTDWAPRAPQDLTGAAFTPVLEMGPEIVLLGTGDHLAWPQREVRLRLQEAGVGLEVMDTPAACRTYNLIMAEGRRVAAALLMPGRG
ncbi:Mth938-like domain-containing protein [Ectothiorhodospira mobilis]|uniref:Mth938-like domain-containing protein n=1 Tax=Ectothiorhodospira mobilis TaxID=195064 RepID=UPI001EE7DBEF|nr:Mth938-like domain-containing protein [Ectothiorhodospira mobilis]MCG5536104.1 Mth938-like domain-containing protein [Ectothiorhodospira mobilis]